MISDTLPRLQNWGLFQLEKGLSPFKRKWLYVNNLNFFVWRKECHQFLLNFWLKHIFSCLTLNWNSPLVSFSRCHRSLVKLNISMLISWPFPNYTNSVHCFPLKNLLRKSNVLMFEHQFRHDVVGLEPKFFWLPLAQQISFMSSTSLCNLSD